MARATRTINAGAVRFEIEKVAALAHRVADAAADKAEDAPLLAWLLEDAADAAVKVAAAHERADAARNRVTDAHVRKDHGGGT